MLMGAFTEYASIVGSKMIFENKSFVDANKDLSWTDGANIAVSAGVGFVSGTAKFAKFMNSSVGKRIMKEIAVAGIENFIKLGAELLIKQRDITMEDAEKLVVGTLVEFGLGKLLPTPAKKNLKEADKTVKYFKNPKYWKAQKAAATQKAAKALNKTGEAINTTVAKTGSKKSDKVIEKANQ